MWSDLKLLAEKLLHLIIVGIVFAGLMILSIFIDVRRWLKDKYERG